MEKDAHLVQAGPCKVHACFEEAETLRILTCLEVAEGKVTYKGATEEPGRRHKHFSFDSISFLTEKLRHTHDPIIASGIEDLLKGKSGSALILGNDEGKKEKILIGESQNQGLLLQFLATLFDTCYERELDDKVTIKLSCWEHREGRIGDLLGGTGSRSHLSNWIAQDSTEGSVVVGIPEIIIRNMKSALKIIRIFMKSLEMSREQGEETESLIFTIKLEIDNGYDKQGKATEYSLSKFHIAKLSHPCTTKAPAKHTNWFVSLFNYLQAQTLEKSTVADNSSSDDEFSSYLKNSLVRGVSSVHCLNVFSNKMNANDCLTALKFTAYLQHLKLQPHSNSLNLSEMSQLKITLENELGKSCKEEKVWTKQVCTWLPTEESTFWLDISTIVSMHSNIMQASNLLEYEYANLLTMGCDKLEKYIYSEEIEDYYYAKKVVLEPYPELQTALERYLDMKRQMHELETRFIRKTAAVIAKVRKEPSQSREFKYLLNSKIRAKHNFEKLFELYGTLSTHFLYEKNEELAKQMMPEVEPIAEVEVGPQEQANFEQIVRELQSKEVVAEAAPVAKKEPRKKRIVAPDQMEMMFTNTNVSFNPHRKRA